MLGAEALQVRTSAPERQISTGVPTLARLITWHLRAVARTAVPVGFEAAAERLRAIGAAHPGRKLIFCWWMEQALVQMAALHVARGPGGYGLPSIGETEFACDEYYGGQLTAEVLARAGATPVDLRWTRPAARAQDLRAIIRSARPLGIAVDGHGPYGRVGPAFARLVMRCGAVAVPLAAWPSRSRQVRIRVALAVPRRRTRLALVVGEPIAAEGSPAELAGRIQSGLEATRAAARRAAGAP